MSANSGTRQFFSSKFLRLCRIYRNHLLVPFDSEGMRGGHTKLWQIWTMDQTQPVIGKAIAIERRISLADAKAIVDEITRGEP